MCEVFAGKSVMVLSRLCKVNMTLAWGHRGHELWKLYTSPTDCPGTSTSGSRFGSVCSSAVTTARTSRRHGDSASEESACIATK